MSLFKKLSSAVEEAGFDAFAVMPAAPLERMRPILEEAQKEKRYPPFVEADIKKRIDPRALLKNAVSVITLALSYKTEDPPPPPPLCGSISRSAWGLDYHRVFRKRMDQLIQFLRAEFRARDCAQAVDTSFLIDRALAIEAGLGYPGSNCAVYVPPFGSWVFLGEVLVDVELPSTRDTQQENWSRPKECAACVQACPTNALTAPGKIQPQRCISYLTQMPGKIPLELREKIGSKLWGCDICQQACPRNQEAQKSPHEEFKPLLGPHLPLLPLLEMDNRQFKKVFGPTSLAWRGKNILQRNACLVLGNQGRAEALAPLQKTRKEHPSEAVREAAQWALEKILGIF